MNARANAGKKPMLAEVAELLEARMRRRGDAADKSAPTPTPCQHETIITDVAVAKGYYMAVPVALFQLVELKKLKPTDVATYCALFDHMSRPRGWRVEVGITQGLSGARPGVARLTRMLGLGDRNAVFASLARLEAAGVITRTRRSQKSNAFTIAPVAQWDRTRPPYRPKRATPRAAAPNRFGRTPRAGNGHAYLDDEGAATAEELF